MEKGKTDANLKNAGKIIIVALEIFRKAGWKFIMPLCEEVKQQY